MPAAERLAAEVVLIAAVAEEDRLIGDGMDLPWHLPEDLQRFKRLTAGYPLLMGRRTFESILHQFGRPLPNRRNLVLSRSATFPDYPEVEVYPSAEAALAAVTTAERLFVAGGATVYAQFLPYADRLELTLVEGDYDGDTYFPPYEHLIGPVFEVAAEELREGYRFVTFLRKKEEGK